jgi:type IV pilus modification protein PilV
MAKYKTKNCRKNGFSMIEVLISVFVLLIGIVGVTSLSISSIKTSMDSRDNSVATQLAQEGIELVRNIRDNNLATGKPAFSGIPAGAGNCAMSYSDSSLKCVSPSYPLNISASGFYTHAAGTATKFKRQVITDASLANQVAVTSEVIWGAAFPPLITNCTTANKCVVVKDTLISR